MAEMSLTQRILKTVAGVINPVVGISYYLTRPNSFTEEVKHFAVIELPTSFRRTLIGMGDEQKETTGVIWVFSKAKSNNTPNIGDLTTLSESVEKLFPMRGEGFSCIDPDVRYMGADDYGYQVSRISFYIFIKRNV